MNAPSSNTAPVELGAAVFLVMTFQAAGSSVFGQVARDVGLAGVTISLTELQLLYWLRSQHPLTRPELVRALAQWRGTGRNEVVAFEAAAAVPALLERMVKDDLLWEMGMPTKRVLVSPKGIALLARLNPSCEDLDLPWRLVRWDSAWPGAAGDAERYVASFVARQRGFVAA